MAWLNAKAATWELWELDRLHEELMPRDLDDTGNLDMRLLHHPDERAAQERFASAARAVLELVPHHEHVRVEQRLRSTTELAFLLLTAQGAEDTGVRAYKGQAPNLQSNSTVLEAALRIHSVEARHASKIRRLRRQTGAPAAVKFSGTVSGGGVAAAGAGNISNPPQGAVNALTLIYAGEDNVTQAGVDVTTLPNLPSGLSAAAASEAFDEPLAKAEVITIVQPFFIPTIPQ